LTIRQKVHKTTTDASYLECFRKSNLRRTGIAIAPYCIQTLSGIYFASNYSTYYYQLAGYSSSESFVLQIIQQVISMIGNVMSWFLVERVGRRPLMFYGLCFLTADLILTGALAVVATPTALKGYQLHSEIKLRINPLHRDMCAYPDILLGLQRHHWSYSIHSPRRDGDISSPNQDCCYWYFRTQRYQR